MSTTYSNNRMVSKKKRDPTVAINEEIHERAKETAKAKGLSMVDFVNDLIETSIKKDEFLHWYYGENLSMAGYHQNSLFIKDTKKGRTAEIFLKDRELYCTLDDSTNCTHIHFALAQPEIAKLQMKRPRR